MRHRWEGQGVRTFPFPYFYLLTPALFVSLSSPVNKETQNTSLDVYFSFVFNLASLTCVFKSL